MADLTTLGVTFHYGVETAKGTKPTAFTWLKRCSSIGGISLDTEQIDVSALEDFITPLKKLMTDTATGKTKGFRVWFEVVFPDLEDAFFVIADPGKNIPLSDIGQNEAATIPLSLIIQEYKGLDTKVVSEELAQALDTAKAVADSTGAMALS